jgi:hypothetical protein
LFVFQTFFAEKHGKILKPFLSPFQLSFEFFTSNRNSGENVFGFPPIFWLKIDGKQTRFFTENSAEKSEFSDWCWS